LIDYATVVNLIGNTTTKQGLTVQSRLDTRIYEKGIKVTDEIFNTIQLTPHKFHGEWNYTIKPNQHKY